MPGSMGLEKSILANVVRCKIDLKYALLTFEKVEHHDLRKMKLHIILLKKLKGDKTADYIIIKNLPT